MAAMRAGFMRLAPAGWVDVAEWSEVERLVCGTAAVDVKAWKGMTRYERMPGGEKHPVAGMFWEVMARLSNEDRSQVKGERGGAGQGDF